MKKTPAEIKLITEEFCDKCGYDDENSIFPAYECLMCKKIDSDRAKDYFVPKAQKN